MARTFKSMLEDVYTSEYKIKKWVDPTTGKTKERKVRPHRVEFDASKLRGEPAQKDAQGDYGMKEHTILEATVKTNHYSWGTMKTVHHGADFSIPLHPEHHEAIAKLQDNQEHHFKTEDGKHWTARRVGADVHFQGANNGQKTTVSHASMREETVQDLTNELHEVLSKDAKAGDWIHDFVHSTNPKFEGKTKKERIKMALGAYYGKQNEEVELQEDKMMPPVHKKVMSKAGNHIGTVYKYDKPNALGYTYGASYHPHGGRGGASGVEWTHHENPESAEKTIHRQHGLYKSAATKAVQKAEKHKSSIPEEGSHDPWFDAQENKKSAESAKKQGDNFAYHLHMADHHENMAHWSMNRGRHHVANQHQAKADQHHDWASELKEHAPVAPVPDRKYIKGTPEWKANKEKSKPINGHPTNMNKEEVELTEANHRDFASQGKMHPDMAKHMKVGQNMDFYANKTGDKISGTVTKNDGKVVHVRADKDGRIASGDKHIFNISSKLDEAAPMAQKLGVNARPKSTEVKSTTKSEVPFDQPYTTNTGNITDKSGAVHSPMSRARDLARKALQKMQEEKAKYAGLEKENKPKLPTALIKKSTNAVDGDTVEGWEDHPNKHVNEAVGPHDAKWVEDTARHERLYAYHKRMGNEAEAAKHKAEIDRLYKKEDVQRADIPAYLRKAKGEKPLELKDLKRKDTISDPENLAKARGVQEDSKLSYKDFAMMLEYEAKDGRYVHKGSYGGSYTDPEGADDADDKKPKQQPAEKRGRGRPAGAKSGARKITGTSKLFK